MPKKVEKCAKIPKKVFKTFKKLKKFFSLKKTF